MDIKQLENEIEKETARSAWNKGVKNYCFEIIDNIKDSYYYHGEDLKSFDFKSLQKLALNGADTWLQYSWSGCSLVYNSDILTALFSPSIVKKYENKDTIRGLHLLDYQARALQIAMSKIYHKIKTSRWAFAGCVWLL